MKLYPLEVYETGIAERGGVYAIWVSVRDHHAPGGQRLTYEVSLETAKRLVTALQGYIDRVRGIIAGN